MHKSRAGIGQSLDCLCAFTSGYTSLPTLEAQNEQNRIEENRFISFAQFTPLTAILFVPNEKK